MDLQKPVYTRGIREGVRTQHPLCIHTHRSRKRTPTCVYAPSARVNAHTRVHAHLSAFTHPPAFTHEGLRIRSGSGYVARTSQNERGSQKYGLPQLCKQTGFDSVWCTLDAIGAETETTLTFAFRACFRGGGPVAADSAAQLLRHAAVRRRATYNALMLLCMLAFWALTTWGRLQYSLHILPATLGMDASLSTAGDTPRSST